MWEEGKGGWTEEREEENVKEEGGEGIGRPAGPGIHLLSSHHTTLLPPRSAAAGTYPLNRPTFPSTMQTDEVEEGREEMVKGRRRRRRTRQ